MLFRRYFGVSCQVYKLNSVYRNTFHFITLYKFVNVRGRYLL